LGDHGLPLTNIAARLAVARLTDASFTTTFRFYTVRVTLLGTGDTTGTPTVACDCDTCARAHELGVERTRFSVHVENERTGESLLIDFSPDFRAQFLANNVALPDAAVVTHIHFDHLDGLGNVFRLLRDLEVHAASEVDPVTGESVAGTVRRRYDYLDQVRVGGQQPGDTFTAAGFDVTLYPVTHPPLVCYGATVETEDATLALTADTNYDVPVATRDALSGADLLLADAIAPASTCEGHPAGGRHHDDDGVPRTFGGKHMTREGALALAEELDARETLLVHCSHYYPPEEAFNPPLAIDGMVREI
jgi:phosphoribosyl 1,2-cyclic phosphate phosphodiesterase